MHLGARTRLAEALVMDEPLVAGVTASFFSRHPEWHARFGELGQRKCSEDARFHLSFLAGAVQAGCADLFTDYARWCGEMLAARKIDRAHLLEHFDLVQEQLSLDREARAYVEAILQAAREALSDGSTSRPSVSDEHAPLRMAYLAAALGGRRAEAWEAIQAAKTAGLSLLDVYTQLLLWSQRRLGELWTLTNITVAQEHMASAVTQSMLARLYPEIVGPRPAGRVLMAGVENELHVLPAQLAADLLELAGWDVAFLGTNVPEQSVLSAIEQHCPDVLGLSVTMGFNLPRTVRLAQLVRAKFPSLPIILGGHAVEHAHDLARELGVDVGPLTAFARYRLDTR